MPPKTIKTQYFIIQVLWEFLTKLKKLSILVVCMAQMQVKETKIVFCIHHTHTHSHTHTHTLQCVLSVQVLHESIPLFYFFLLVLGFEHVNPQLESKGEYLSIVLVTCYFNTTWIFLLHFKIPHKSECVGGLWNSPSVPLPCVSLPQRTALLVPPGLLPLHTEWYMATSLCL